jgi:hypothetical protein
MVAPYYEQVSMEEVPQCYKNWFYISSFFCLVALIR